MSNKRLMAALQQMDSQVFGHIEDTLADGAAISAKRDAPLDVLNLAVRGWSLKCQIAEDVLNLAVRGWSLKCQIADLENELKAIQEQLLTGIGVGHAVVVDGVTRATLTERNTVSIDKPAHLKTVLGSRWDDLVKVNVTYKAEPKLIELACGGDDVLAEAIRDCLTVKSTQSVTWRPSK